jgi:uncharacterized protein
LRNAIMSDEEAAIDFARIWRDLAERFRLGVDSIHGPAHWQRVERWGLRLVDATPSADRLVVRLFAVFHDCQRWNEWQDIDHGRRAARYLRRTHGRWFSLAAARLELLAEACAGHVDGSTSTDPTIGCCWDADRLDLPRVAIVPDPQLMSTPHGRELAQSERRRIRAEKGPRRLAVEKGAP